MTVLITRPISDALRLQQRIEESTKAPTLLEPMIEVSIEPKTEVLDLKKYNSLIFTSRNSVSYLRQYNCSEFLTKRCFAIGDSTKEELESMGFQDVFSAQSDIEKLIEAVLEFGGQDPLYLRGDMISRDLKKDIFCYELLCYKVAPTEKLSQNLIDSMQSGDIKVAVFFSENTAKVFLSLCKKYGVAKFLKNITILTVSYKLKNYMGLYTDTQIESFEGDELLLDKLINTLYV